MEKSSRLDIRRCVFPGSPVNFRAWPGLSCPAHRLQQLKIVRRIPQATRNCLIRFRRISSASKAVSRHEAAESILRCNRNATQDPRWSPGARRPGAWGAATGAEDRDDPEGSTDRFDAAGKMPATSCPPISTFPQGDDWTGDTGRPWIGLSRGWCRRFPTWADAMPSRANRHRQGLQAGCAASCIP